MIQGPALRPWRRTPKLDDAIDLADRDADVEQCERVAPPDIANNCPSALNDTSLVVR
jgi:hypothetical protein